MEDNLFLGCECIEFAAKSFKVAVYYRGPSFCRAFEKCMFREMGYALMVAGFVSCAAFDA
jgi:hypothetical protein